MGRHKVSGAWTLPEAPAEQFLVTVASLHGEHQLADVLAGEQLRQGIREGANAALEDVFA